jgi:hypothetical protein
MNERRRQQTLQEGKEWGKRESRRSENPKPEHAATQRPDRKAEPEKHPPFAMGVDESASSSAIAATVRNDFMALLPE